MLHFPTGMLWFLKSFSTYIGGFWLKLGSNATHLLKNATMFAKGCCIHGGMVFFMQSHFTSDPRVRFHPYDFFRSYIWWTSRQYKGLGLEACVNWHLDEDTQHLAMSKKAHAHSPQLSRLLGPSFERLCAAIIRFMDAPFTGWYLYIYINI